MKHVIGIDVGTGSLHAVLYDTAGVLVDEQSVSYETKISQSGYSEQNPADWIYAFKKSVSKIIDRNGVSDSLVGIGLSGQMHTLVLLDENDNVIRPAILWNDVRNKEEVLMLSSDERIVEKSKNKVLEGFTLPKLSWVKNNEPENWRKINKFFLPSSYLAYIMTGNATIDYSDASGTLLVDHETNTWNYELFHELGLPLSSAPSLQWGELSGDEMLIDFKKELGITSKSVLVFNGSADNAAALLATGISDFETALLSIGTSGVLMMLEQNESDGYDGDLHYFHHVLEDTYYSMGVTLSAGKSLSWIKNILNPDISFDKFLEHIDDIEAGSNNLLFAPYIMGERTPYADADIRGTFIGLDISHTKNHIIKSVLEGITFSLKDSYEILTKNGKEISSIISVGGGAKSESWLQIQADIFNVPVTKLESNQGASYGAVMIALKRLGFEESLKNMYVLGKTFYPNTENVRVYEKSYERYKKIYKNIRLI